MKSDDNETTDFRVFTLNLGASNGLVDKKLLALKGERDFEDGFELALHLK